MMNMTRIYFVLVIGSIVHFALSTSASDPAEATTTKRRHLLPKGFECTLYIKSISYADRDGEEIVSCEVTPQSLSTIAARNGDNNAFSATEYNDRLAFKTSEMIDIEGISPETINMNGLISGAAIMRINGGYIDVKDEIRLVVPHEAKVEFEDLSENDTRHYLYRRRRRQIRRNLAPSTGDMKTLVLRVKDSKGVEPTLSTSQLESDIFKDEISMARNFESCSHGKMKVHNMGIKTIEVNVDSAAVHFSDIEKVALEVATSQFGGPNNDLRSNYDLVMYCMPPGAAEFIGYAYLNGASSFYYDVWCGKVSIGMHEVGHNLGLAHSGEGDDQYGDQSGVMGYGYGDDNGPVMCFNAAKNYQLGWFTNQQMSYNPLVQIENPQPKHFTLNGVDDAVSGYSNNLITLRLETDGFADYYVGYNRAIGMNSGTLEGRNEVIIMKKEAGGPNNHGKSWKVASLKSNEAYTITDWDGSIFDVTIAVIGEIGENIKDAKISVTVSDFYPTQSPTLSCGGGDRFRIELGIDPFGQETSWTLKEQKSQALLASGSKEKYHAKQEYSEPYDTTGASSFCLEPSTCYDFEIFDSYGDGICCKHSVKGYYRGILNGAKIFEGGDFGASEKKTFCTGATAPSPLPTRYPTATPTKAPTPPPITNSGDCKDEKNGTYRIKKKKKRDICKWASKVRGKGKTEKEKNRKRRKKCKRLVDDLNISVKELCPIVCGKAGLKTCYNKDLR